MTVGQPELTPLPPIDVAPRTDRLRTALETVEADWMVVSSLVNIRWLTGFTGSNAVVLVGDESQHLLTDARYDERAAAELAAAGSQAEVHIVSGGFGPIAAGLVGDSRVAGEADVLTWAARDRLEAEWIGGRGLVATEGLIAGLRARKDDAEVARIERAAGYVDTALGEVAPALRGLTEREAARRIEATIRSAGADDIGFDAIVASGPNGAIPHHSPGERAISDGDLVIIDIGARVDGYRSDMTRTFSIGEMSTEQQRQYDVVVAAQQAGVDAMVAGAPTRDVDAAARAVIDDAGWADAFPHGTGHGIGLDIHELPTVGTRSTEVYEVGTVATVEPGVYLSGSGGVRVEDTLVVTSDGARRLTGFAKEPVLLS